MEFYSQHFQDVFIFRNLINQPDKKGIFVEIGGYDGINHSNSKFFEDNLNFTGMLIEPNPSIFEQMIKNRPNCNCSNYAISKHVGKIDFSIPDTISAMGGITDTTPWGSEFKLNSISVDSIPFNEILNKNVYDYIDIMFIDVEGGELDVLETMDWTISIYIICIELDNQQPKKDSACRKIMIDNGFVLECKLQLNEVWINIKNKRDILFVKKTMHEFDKPVTIVNGISKNTDGIHKQSHEGFVDAIYNIIRNYENNNL